MKYFCLGLALALFLAAGSVWAQAGSEAGSESGEPQRLSLDFQKADIHTILRVLAEVSGRDMIIADGVSGQVTVKVQDLSWSEALQTVLSSLKLRAVESGSVLLIEPDQSSGLSSSSSR